MLISGIQKMTLLDYPNHIACTIFTDRCNFQCPFCHNASLVVRSRKDYIDVNSVLEFLSKRKGIIEGVVVSGGEPILQYGIEDFLRKVHSMGFLIKLDTNGSYPLELRNIVFRNLVDMVAMDIKNSPSLYNKTTGLKCISIASIKESKNFLLKGYVSYEFRTTVVKGLHTKESLIDAAKFIKGASEYYLQQYVDSGDVISGEGLSAFSDSEMQELLKSVQTIIPNARIRGIDNH